MHTYSLFYNYNPDLRRILVDGEVVGDITWKIHHDLAFQNFETLPSGFGFLRNQISQEQIMPIQYIADINVREKFRGNGYAGAAMQLALTEAAEEGAKIAFLRVGWPSTDNWKDIKCWLTSWYQRLGFILLKNELDDTIIPYLWRPLSLMIPEAISNVTLQKDSEPEDSFSPEFT